MRTAVEAVAIVIGVGSVAVACASFTATEDHGHPDAGAERDAGPGPSPSAEAGVADPAIQITAGNGLACALRQSGRIACWGSNVNGAIGVDGLADENCSPLADKCRPTAQAATLVTDARQISVGRELACAVSRSNELKCWGKNSDDAALGTGSVVPPTSFAPLTSLEGMLDVATGGTGGCARVVEDGGTRVYCWGSDALGLTGQPPSTETTAPVVLPDLDGALAVRMSTSYPGSACALLPTGRVVCWGWSAYGNLGQDPGKPMCGMTSNDCNDQRQPIELENVTDVQVGDAFACALTRDARVFCWGTNNQGQLGIGSFDGNRHPTPTLVPGLADVTRISAHGGHACALSKDGSLRCWGRDSTGEIGSFTGQRCDVSITAKVACVLSPTVAAASVAGITDVAAGEGFTLVLAGGIVYAWGTNGMGQLGHERTLDPKEVCNDLAPEICNKDPIAVVLP